MYSKSFSQEATPKHNHQNQIHEQEPNLNDCLENVHYFPDEKSFQEPFTESNNQNARPYTLVKNEVMKDTSPPDEQQMLYCPAAINKQVHFADDSVNDRQI